MKLIFADDISLRKASRSLKLLLPVLLLLLASGCRQITVENRSKLPVTMSFETRHKDDYKVEKKNFSTVEPGGKTSFDLSGDSYGIAAFYSGKQPEGIFSVRHISEFTINDSQSDGVSISHNNSNDFPMLFPFDNTYRMLADYNKDTLSGMLLAEVQLALYAMPVSVILMLIYFAIKRKKAFEILQTNRFAKTFIAMLIATVLLFCLSAAVSYAYNRLDERREARLFEKRVRVYDLDASIWRNLNSRGISCDETVR